MFQHPFLLFSLLKKTEAEQLLCQQTGQFSKRRSFIILSQNWAGRAPTIDTLTSGLALDLLCSVLLCVILSITLSVTECSYIYLLCNLISWSCNQSGPVNKTTPLCTTLLWFCFCLSRSKTRYSLTYLPRLTTIHGNHKNKGKTYELIWADITYISTEARSHSRILCVGRG